MLGDLGRLLQRTSPEVGVVQCADADSALELLAVRDVHLIMLHLRLSPEDMGAICARLAGGAPQALRIVLCEPQASVPEFIEHAHQVLVADKSAASLEHIVRDALAMQHALQSNPALMQMVGRLQKVPSPPSLYFELREQIDRAGADLEAIARVSASDPALVARLLRVVNSGLYGLPRTITDVGQAVGLIGTDALLGLVLATHVFSGMPPPGIRLEALWQHATAVAELAQSIAREEGLGPQERGHSAVAGLLHDLGVLVLMENEAVRYQPLWRQARGVESELRAGELASFGFAHDELSAALLALWGLPEEIVSAVRSSHHALEQLVELPPSARAVCLAEAWVEYPQVLQHQALSSSVPPELLQQWQRGCETFSGVSGA